MRSKAVTSITIPYKYVHTPDLSSPSPVRVRGCRLVVARLRRLTRPRAPCNGHPSPLPGVAWRSAPLNVQTWANRGSSARWAAASGSLRSSRRALTRWALGSRARSSSAVHSCSEFRPGHCSKNTRQPESEGPTRKRTIERHPFIDCKRSQTCVRKLAMLFPCVLRRRGR